jgi:hypothetical protein
LDDLEAMPTRPQKTELSQHSFWFQIQTNEIEKPNTDVQRESCQMWIWQQLLSIFYKKIPKETVKTGLRPARRKLALRKTAELAVAPFPRCCVVFRCVGDRGILGLRRGSV